MKSPPLIVTSITPPAVTEVALTWQLEKKTTMIGLITKPNWAAR